MRKQAELFPRPETIVAVHGSRRDPPVWIRRLVIWEKPGSILRDIPLRRGLNILWSPDPGSSAAKLGLNSESGHGAGKTLFCRLLRYCLGEDRFAGEELRRNIVAALPEGMVGAEIVVNGVPWAVVRPLGRTRKEFALVDNSLDGILPPKGAGLDDFREALNKMIPPTIEADWLFVLAWLTRDQECRFDDIFDWRRTSADSGGEVSREDAILGARALLGILDDEEVRLKTERRRLNSEKQNRLKRLEYSHARVAELQAKLIEALGLASAEMGGALDLSTIRAAVEERLAKADAEAANRPFAAQIEALGRQRDDLVSQTGVLQAEIKQLERRIENQKSLIAVIQGEQPGLSAEELKVRFGPNCEVCGVPIDRALLEGCPIAIKQPSRADVAAKQAENRRSLDDCQSSIRLLQGDINQRKVDASLLAQRQGEIERSIDDLHQQETDRHRHRMDAVAKVLSVQNQADELAALQREIESSGADTGEFDRQIREASQRESALRESHSASLGRLSELFSYVGQGLCGTEIQGRISVTDEQRLKVNFPVGGQAMESLKAIAFDVAAMLMSIEGKASLPAFLLHDSPREADLGQSIYDRIFRFAQSLESVASEPPFQYIVTTTSDPPPEFRQAPYLISKLSGSVVEERLLRRVLG
jgi:hypothetical protein